MRIFSIGDDQTYEKFVRRTVKVTKEHNDDCKRLLKLMGVPFVEAPAEAEARKKRNFVGKRRYSEIIIYLECAALVKQGKVYGVGTEDMDVKKTFFNQQFSFEIFRH